MIAKVLLTCASLAPSPTRWLLRRYLLSGRDVPRRAEWLVSQLQNRVTPSRSIRTVRLADGVELEIDLATAIGKTLYYRGGSEPEIRDFLKTFLKPGMTFIDAGANIGEVTILAGRLIGPKGAVIALEISPRTLPRLKRNIAINRLSNVQVIEAALVDQEGPVAFYLGRGDDSGSSSVTQPHDFAGELISVPGTTLDALVSRLSLDRVDLVKLDIEGAEMVALRGAEGLLSGANPPTLILEYQDYVAARMDWSLEDLRRFLGEWGYTIRNLSGSASDSLQNLLALPRGSQSESGSSRS